MEITAEIIEPIIRRDLTGAVVACRLAGRISSTIQDEVRDIQREINPDGPVKEQVDNASRLAEEMAQPLGGARAEIARVLKLIRALDLPVPGVVTTLGQDNIPTVDEVIDDHRWLDVLPITRMAEIIAHPRTPQDKIACGDFMMETAKAKIQGVLRGVDGTDQDDRRDGPEPHPRAIHVSQEELEMGTQLAERMFAGHPPEGGIITPAVAATVADHVQKAGHVRTVAKAALGLQIKGPHELTDANAPDFVRGIFVCLAFPDADSLAEALDLDDERRAEARREQDRSDAADEAERDAQEDLAAKEAE